MFKSQRKNNVYADQEMYILQPFKKKIHFIIL